jgi:hypothetical protein
VLLAAAAVPSAAPGSPATLGTLSGRDAGGGSLAMDAVPTRARREAHPSLGIDLMISEWGTQGFADGRYALSLRSALAASDLTYLKAGTRTSHAVPDTLIPFQRKNYVQFSRQGSTWLLGRNLATPTIILIDTATGRNELRDLPDGDPSWSTAIGPDGKVYIGTVHGSLLCYDPATDRIDTIEKGTLGGIVMALAFVDRFLVWGAYPERGGVYDWKERKILASFSPFDQESPASRYVDDIIVAPDGRVVVIGRMPAMHLTVLDPATGTREAKTPEVVKDHSRGAIGFMDGTTLSFIGKGELFLFDYPSFALRSRHALPKGSPLWLDHKLHLVSGNGQAQEILEPNVDFSSWTPTWQETSAKLGAGWPIIGTGSQVFTISADGGKLISYDPATRAYAEHALEMRGHIPTHALCVVPEAGKIFGAPFINQRFWDLDLATGAGRDLGRAAAGGGQINGMVWDANRKRLFQASYTTCTVTEYDPSRPNGWPENPKQIAQIGDEQMRPNGFRSFISDGRYLWMASSAEYGKLGGALSRIDPNDGTKQVWRNIAVDQTPNALVLDPTRHRIYLSTDIHADQQSVKPTQSCAKLISFDTDSLSTVAEVAPFPGAEALTVLVLTEPGRLLVRAQRRLFLWTPDRGTFDDLGPEPCSLTDIIRTDDGRLIASAWGRIGYLALDGATTRFSPFICESGEYLQLSLGRLWYVAGKAVKSIVLP